MTAARADMSSLNDCERALVEKVKAEGFSYDAGCNLADLIRRAGLTLSFYAAPSETGQVSPSEVRSGDAIALIKDIGLQIAECDFAGSHYDKKVSALLKRAVAALASRTADTSDEQQLSRAQLDAIADLQDRVEPARPDIDNEPLFPSRFADTSSEREVVEKWRDDALEAAAQIVLQWKADPAIAFDIRQLKSSWGYELPLSSQSASGAEGSGDYLLPCDVRLDPATIIRKGCKLSVLMTAFQVREDHANSGTFLGYRNAAGDEMHCANAFCPHPDKCSKGCANRKAVAVPSADGGPAE